MRFNPVLVGFHRPFLLVRVLSLAHTFMDRQLLAKTKQQELQRMKTHLYSGNLVTFVARRY